MPDSSDDNNQDFQSLDFDEKMEIEKLQATIKSMSNFSDDSEGFLSQSPKALMDGGSSMLDNSESSEEFDPYAAIEKPVTTNNGPRAKKFVIMINSENVEFFDKIPMEERTKLFNTLLTNYQKKAKATKEKIHLIKFAKHMFLGIMVVLVTLPIMFLVVNKSIEMTINNYKDVQNSFERLYENSNAQGRFNTHKTIY